MGFIQFIANLLKDPRAAIAGWIAMGVAPTLGFVFLIVFIETGVVFFPFLPGDSLLFAAGFFAAPDAATGKSALPLAALLPVVWLAPILGDQCNYFIGHFFGRRIIESGKVKAMTPERLAKTEKMIDRWGPLAVFLGRFFPFIRTFMPFISGISGMRWSRFTPFSVLGGLVWSSLFTLLPDAIEPIPRIFICGVLPGIPSFTTCTPEASPCKEFSKRPPCISDISSLLILETDPIISRRFLVP